MKQSQPFLFTWHQNPGKQFYAHVPNFLVVPAILLATGKLKVPLIQSVSFYGFIGFSLFGGIILLAGLFGTFTAAGFLSNACAGTDLATRFALRALGYAAKGL
jgi:hypothetical protein